jgi:prefoldin subunit 5
MLNSLFSRGAAQRTLPHETGLSKLLFRALALLIISIAIAGCQTMKDGGAPDPAFDIEADMKALAAEFNTATQVSAYYATAADKRIDARNRFISGRLIQIDLRYIQFIRSLNADRQKIETAADLANLSLSIAGTLTGGLQAKSNLAAAATAVTGTKTTIDKEYFYEKSMNTLVGTMNAKRKEVLVGILQGMTTRAIDEYPFEMALRDLNDYYLAGTVNGALNFINAQAASQEKASDEKIKEIPRLTKTNEEIVTSLRELNEALAQPQVTAASAQSVLTALGDTTPRANDLNTLKEALRAKLRAVNRMKTIVEKVAETERLRAAFKAAGWMK